MTQNQPLLYPRLSSIYNKITQLAIAIILIVVAMNVWVFSYGQQKAAIDEHFIAMSDSIVEQMAVTSLTLWYEKPEKIQQFIDQSVKTPWVKDISVYDETGQLLYASQERQSVLALYGLGDNAQRFTPIAVPVVKEIRDNQLRGYLRVTLLDKPFTESLSKASDEQHALFRIMMMIAGVVGFLLTRGLNRFSRQSYRMAKKVK